MAITQQDALIYAEVARARAQAITRPATPAEHAKTHSCRTKDSCVRAALRLFVKWHFEEEVSNVRSNERNVNPNRKQNTKG